MQLLPHHARHILCRAEQRLAGRPVGYGGCIGYGGYVGNVRFVRRSRWPPWRQRPALRQPRAAAANLRICPPR
eukprot:scaffold19350_cov116-Isochrysis_galbana.AAC.3